MTNTLILAAGKFDPKNISASMIGEAGLMPIHGKPAISWVVDSAIKSGADNIKIVLRRNDSRLSHVLAIAYPKVKQFFIESDEDVSASLIKVLALCDDNYPTQIILGDTFINEPFPKESDVFLSSVNIKSSKLWCLVSTDSNRHITNVFNKESDISLRDKEALVGFYKFSNTKLLKDIALNLIKNGSGNFVKILAIYNSQIPVVIKRTENWYDFGHISGTVKARQELFSAREFNSLKVDSVRGVVTKYSKKKQKLLDEANWYKSLPAPVACLAPRVLNVEEDSERVGIEMEFYGYSNLAENYIYGSGSIEDWCNVITSLFKLHKQLENYTEPVDYSELEEIYKEKTLQRIGDIQKKYKDIARMMKSDYIEINNSHLKNFNLLKDTINKKIQSLCSYSRRTIVHGDYCFSNILFDPSNYIFRLIDPRGRFKTQSIYGDPRYDIAKMRHSVVGLYDFIVAGLYNLHEDPVSNVYEFKIMSPFQVDKLEAFFDEQVTVFGYNPREIRLIEALLFLTMIPLHGEDLQRQKMFYLTAIQKFNEVINDDQ